MNNNNAFENKEEALDFLLDELADRKQKEEWAKTLAGNPEKKAKVISFRKKIVSVAAMAASIALICFFVLNNQVPAYEQMASNMITELNIEFDQATRGTEDIKSVRESEVIEALDEKNYQKVLKIYESDDSNFSINDKFYLSYSLAKLENQDHQLILNLTKDIIDSESEYTADALLISAYANIELGNIKNAKADLLRAQPYKYKTKEIDNLLKLLKKD